MEMNFAEKFNILFFSVISLLVWIIPLPLRRRMAVWAIGALGVAVCLLMTFSPAVLPQRKSDLLREWMPAALILVAYHQSGQLFQKPRYGFQTFMLALDRRLLEGFFQWLDGKRFKPFLSGYLEISYLACYPLVPAALGVLVLLNLQERIEEFWMVVLPSCYTCYAMIPLFPAFPPRMLNAARMAPIHTGRTRALNEFILRHASIQANTFPSAHVAACMAASLVLLRYDACVGAGFLWVSLSIAAAVTVRRYHYLADAVFGIALPLIPFFLTG
jgi:hypothetical protein